MTNNKENFITITDTRRTVLKYKELLGIGILTLKRPYNKSILEFVVEL